VISRALAAAKTRDLYPTCCTFPETKAVNLRINLNMWHMGY